MKDETRPDDETIEQRFVEVRARQQQMIEKYGFTIDMVFPSGGSEHWNIHTHGVLESFGHPDFQVVLNIGQRNVLGIFHLLVDRVKKGEKFVEGTDYDCIAQGFPTRFIKAKECGREVLRLIVPDTQGHLDPQSISYPYSLQYENLETA
jgi:hypothetical protein